MKNQTYRMTMLFDFYGEILTERQKEFFDLYYNEDLSLGEIAENSGITRQGVRDIIVRAERTLLEVEEKTGLIRRFHETREATARIRAICGFLAETELKMLEIAELFSFSSAAHFSAYFKQHTGTTPREYRSACRQGKRPSSYNNLMIL